MERQVCMYVFVFLYGVSLRMNALFPRTCGVFALLGCVCVSSSQRGERLVAPLGQTRDSLSLHPQVLWFLARWARTYALPDSGLYESHPLSKALVACYGSDPAELHAALSEGLGRPTPLGLAVLPTSPGMVGGRAVLDFVVQVRSLRFVFPCGD